MTDPKVLMNTFFSNVVRELDFQPSGTELEIHLFFRKGEFDDDDLFKVTFYEGQKTMSFVQVLQIARDIFEPVGFKVEIEEAKCYRLLRSLSLRLELKSVPFP